VVRFYRNLSAPVEHFGTLLSIRTRQPGKSARSLDDTGVNNGGKGSRLCSPNYKVLSVSVFSACQGWRVSESP